MVKSINNNSVQPVFVAVDCIIFGFDEDGLKLLLLKRTFEPAQGQWSLMGGIVNVDESVDAAAARVLEELTGLNNVYLDQLCVFSDVDRYPDNRVISVAYSALINIELYNKELVEKYNAYWININALPPLAFDHSKMVAKALKSLQQMAVNQPMGLNLLPEKFTLTQLQRLYEAIFQRELDKRNFRKKILAMGVLRKLNEKDKTSSRRGAFKYRFNVEKYLRLKADNLMFGD